MIRLRSLLAIVAVAVSLVGCDTRDRQQPFETSLPSQNLGFRVTDGKLAIWMGSTCEGTTEVVVDFSSPEVGEAKLDMYTPTLEDRITPGVGFEYFTLGDPSPGFTVKTPLPPGFDWRTAQYIRVNVGGPPVSRGIGDVPFAPIAKEITEHSADHPQDTYFFPELGWLSRAEVAAKDGKEFMTVCTPDPKRNEAVVATIGVRVTDGDLRFWTGTPCPFDTGVVLYFQPSQATLILRNSKDESDFEYLSLNRPEPQFEVSHRLPPGFDWRTASSVLVRLVDDDRNLVWTKTTDLTIPLAESARHAPDSYYFQGIGWLDPAEVLARTGTTLTTPCARKS